MTTMTERAYVVWREAYLAAEHQKRDASWRRCRIVAVTLKANGKRISLPNSRTK
jgi:hypothetical protein